MEKKYERFGVMLDCSRNAVMTVSAVKRMIDCLAKMGYDTLELYTEDTYEVEGEPFFGYLRGRYTGEEIQEIDAYAKAHGVELIPCIQTLAHFTAFVRNGQCGGMFDTADILLVGEDRTYEFIDHLFASLAKNFSSRQVNIGMDEAHMVGLGRYLDKHGHRNRFDILIEHLQKVAEIAKKYGFPAHMWSDMFFRLANNGGYYSNNVINVPDNVKKSLPDNVDLVYWDYYHVEKEIYDVMFQSHEGFNGETWFAGGAWSWDGFAPYNAKTLKTMKPAMESVIEHGVKNVLITMWGDNGRECSPFALLPSLYAVRQYAEGNFDQEKIEKGFNELFGLDYADFSRLDIPNKLSANAEDWFGNPCKSLLYPDPFMGLLDHSAEQRPIPYAQYSDILAEIAPRMGDFAYLFESMSKLCSVLAIKAELGVKTRKAYKAGDKKALTALIGDYKEVDVRLDAFHAAFYALWHKDNKPYGWEIQDARLGGLSRRIKTCAMRLEAYVAGKTDKIEELEEEILPYYDGMMSHNNYESMISRSLL